MRPKNVLYYGDPQPLPAREEFRAGPVSLQFDAQAGSVHHIRVGNREIIRSIYSALRNPNWGTVAQRLSNLRSETSGGGFRITFDVECRENEIDFLWQGTVTGDAWGTVTFIMDGAARSTFRKNRLGFCVLHPMDCAGAAARMEKVDGTVEAGAFPRYISPHQPFMGMKAIAHEVAPGLWAEVRFEGDEFEMEDQRNWTDASFKTYCTPLRLPFPAEVQEGTRIYQAVAVSIQGDPAAVGQAAGEDGQIITFAVSDDPGAPLPRLGLGVASHGQPLTGQEVERLQALGLSHLRVDLRLSDPGWEKTLQMAARQAESLGCPLEAALHVTDAAGAELRQLVQEAGRAQPPIGSWLLFHEGEKSTSEKWMQLAREILKGYDPAIPFGSGTDCFFTELNRGRPPAELIDVAVWSINPQVHAFDNESLAETLAAQATNVETARQFIAGCRIAVSPVTLRMRFNPNATGPQPEPAPGELPPQVDVRQMSLFGAGWTLGSLKYLAESGADSVTYYETTGWCGVMETGNGSPLPAKFGSTPGAVFPLYHVLADVGEFAGGRVIASTSSALLQADGLVLERDGRRRLMLANLSPHCQYVRVQNPGLGEYVRLKRLDQTTAEAAMTAPEAYRREPGLLVQTAGDVLEVALLPYAVVRVDSSER